MMNRTLQGLCLVAAALGLLAAAVAPPARAAVDATVLAAEASAALHRAVAFYREQIASEGSYLWKYSPDLTVRKGEGDATPSQGWVQPPGTPAIGLAYLDAWEATGDEYILEGAVETAHALVATQLVSGGWFHWIEFDPVARLAWCYRLPPSGCAKGDDGAAPALALPDGATPEGAAAAFHANRDRNASTLDDAITQSALTLLIRVDAAQGGSDPAIRAAAEYGLAKLLEMQYPNGAWPERFDWKVPDVLTVAAWRARFPATWSRSFVPRENPEVYELNDHILRNVMRVLLLADRVYGRPEYRAAALRAGEFLLAAQMPAPQPGWAQQYNQHLEPIWGRKFEPPAVAAWETGSTIEALLELHLVTGDARYLQAAGRAARWLERVRFPDGQWARFYELETNRPLYMTEDYALTYDASDVPAHYGFIGRFGLPEVLDAYHRLVSLGREAYRADAAATADAAGLGAQAEAVEAELAALDEQGRWIDHDMIRSAAFIEHLGVLSNYVAAERGHRLPALH